MLKEKLKKFKTKEGLISTKNISFDNEIMMIDNIEVEEIFELRQLVNYLKENQKLWNITFLLIQEKTYISRSSAPLINITFDKALDIILKESKLKNESLFRIDKEYSQNQIGGTLFACFERKKLEIHFQLWQIYHINNEHIDVPTHFIHGIFDIDKLYFTHFDGALIEHSKKYRDIIESGKIPPKTGNYSKIFRLDGKIDIKQAKEMMSIYLPFNELTNEFLKVTLIT